MQISLLIGIASVVLSVVMGVGLGLLSGYVGGRLDAFIMRVCDVMLSFPAILVALLIDGVARAVLAARFAQRAGFRRADHCDRALGLGAVRAHGARLHAGGEEQGVHPGGACDRRLAACMIMLKHVLPNVLGPVLVLATVHIATAIITEATLSFLGVGVPPTTPSLGTLIRIGNEFLFSGEWWITIFPGLALILLVLSVNLLGDWLRDALNPKLR